MKKIDILSKLKLCLLFFLSFLGIVMIIIFYYHVDYISGNLINKLVYIFNTISTESTCKKYGWNIVCYDFSKIPFKRLLLNKEVLLTADLNEFLNDELLGYSVRIKNKKEFERMFWKEAAKLGLDANKFQKMDVAEAIKAVVDIIGSRFTYHNVDEDLLFINKYGKYLPIEDYFRLGLGDCDKYADATIAAFKIIKPLNFKLQNIYLTREELGGNIELHAWVAVVIIQPNWIILSHIDPTFADNGAELEATDYHITRKNKIFIYYFYRALPGEENQICGYQVLEKALEKIISKTHNKNLLFLENDILERESSFLLEEMSFQAWKISIYNPKMGVEKIEKILSMTTEKTMNLEDIWYYAYRIYFRAGNHKKAEKYKQLLIKEFPDSFWIKYLKNGVN